MAEKLIDRDGVSMDGKAVEKDDKQLLALDLSQERAQVAIATGDVDVAENVAVFTPVCRPTRRRSTGTTPT